MEDNHRQHGNQNHGVVFGAISLLIALILFLLAYINQMNAVLIGLGTLMLAGGVTIIVDTLDNQ